MKKMIDNGNIMDISGGGFQRVYRAAHVIGTNMHLHAEVPLVAFLGLAHL